MELQGFPASASAVGMAVAASSCTSDFIITNIVGSAVSFQDHQIADGSYFYSSVIAANLDGDTDIDVLFASADDRLVAWYENDGTEISTTAHVISVDEIAPSFIHVADVDNDGDLDILSTSASDNTLVLFENSGGISIAFTMHVIAESVAEASSVFAADLDGDGRKDVIVSSAGDDTIAWYKNENSTGISSTANIITTNADGAACLYAFDADSDGDFDILTASSIDDTITLHRGNGDGTFSITAEIISTSAIGAASVYAADIDADGHMDVIAASAGDDTVAWYRNDGSGTINTTRNIITSIADGASIVIAIDLNGDDLKDVLVGSTAGNTVAWYENDGAGHISTTPHIITTEASGVAAVFAADIDDDGDTDVFVADPTNDNTLWYENTNDVTASATFSALSRRAPTDIDFTFFSAFEITTGLNMVLVLPGFTDADEYDTDTTHSLSISGTDAVYFTSSQAVWNAATQTITLTVDDDVRIVPLTTLSVTISSDSELLAPSGGLSENDENFIYYLNNINKGVNIASFRSSVYLLI